MSVLEQGFPPHVKGCEKVEKNWVKLYVIWPRALSNLHPNKKFERTCRINILGNNMFGVQEVSQCYSRFYTCGNSLFSFCKPLLLAPVVRAKPPRRGGWADGGCFSLMMSVHLARCYYLTLTPEARFS